VQLLKDRYEGSAMKPNSVRKEDFQYIRNGTCLIFMFTVPLESWCHVDAQEHRTKIDDVHQIDYLVNTPYTLTKRKSDLYKTTLNTHTVDALSEAFPAEKAQAMAERFEIFDTPKHMDVGST
jgi:hypothetical protein